MGEGGSGWKRGKDGGERVWQYVSVGSVVREV